MSEEKVGRPTKYNPDFHPRWAETLAEAGLVDEQIAEKMGIATATLYNWQNEYPLFLEAIKRGKEAPDDVVERALFERATGYSHDAVKIFFRQGDEEPTYAAYKEHFPPDVGAQIFWLKNRRPSKWRDRREIEFEDDKKPIRIEVDHTINISETETVEVNEPRATSNTAD